MSLEPRSSAAPSGGTPPLDGEVILPRMREVNPKAEAAAAEEPQPPHGLRIGAAVVMGVLIAALAGVGGVEGYRWHLHRAGPSPTGMALAALKREVASLQADRADERAREAAALQADVVAIRAELGALKTGAAELAARFDGRAAAPAGPVLTEVMARLDRLDRDSRLADLSARLDRVEHEVASPVPVGSVAPKTPAGSGQNVVMQSPAPPSRPGRAAVLDNWIVRDVYSGIALVEGRSGSVREVVPGEVLPGAGEVRSIERHGRRWIVVTSRGIIDTETW